MNRSPVTYAIIIAFTLVAIILAFFLLSWFTTGTAQAQSTDQAVYDMLHHLGSPLADEAYTVVAFRRANPEFNILDFYALVWAESSLGKDSSVRRHHNIGSIRGGTVGSAWRDLRSGTFGNGYNEYATFRDGQRAALRLVLERYGGSVLRGNGLLRYYGVGVAGWSHYSGNVYAARRILEREGREHGLSETHLQ